ncbi:diaminopropionate ammonia-lyase [Cupriavidus sp. BIS7]|uniref:diaminopropionate ammonia-lyase n=1 Tax=Cupriavidus sp. BIS7 TaxID=1217718 RepID=UPI000A0046BB|nr:diaminopropionate ammonia-lyase [Cupriavidus sp. BIS7]
MPTSAIEPRVPNGNAATGTHSPSLFANPQATRASYPAELRAIMCIERAEESRRWLAAWSGIARQATPLYDLPGLAQKLRVARFSVKDESVRSPLGSFKALGAPIALVRQILRLHPEFEPASILTGSYAKQLKDYTVISATDGNHGRGLAAAARDAGCRCVIVLHANVSVEREEAIAEFGAEIVRIKGNYDESVEEAARLSAAHGWQVVSDTSYEGYEDIPRDVMQGYGTIAAEIVEQTDARANEAGAFTHVFLQGGVGGMAAGLFSYLWEFQGEHRPHFIVVEPDQADCLLQSAIQGRAAKATGSIDSVMAGLACGETSPLAWKFLQTSADHFMTIEDGLAVEAMKTLANGSEKDIPIVAGESGTAGLAALEVLRANDALSAQVKLDANSRVLIINTEGATAPLVYKQLVGCSAEEIAAKQAAWRTA